MPAPLFEGCAVPVRRQGLLVLGDFEAGETNMYLLTGPGGEWRAMPESRHYHSRPGCAVASLEERGTGGGHRRPHRVLFLHPPTLDRAAGSIVSPSTYQPRLDRDVAGPAGESWRVGRPAAGEVAPGGGLGEGQRLGSSCHPAQGGQDQAGGVGVARLPLQGASKPELTQNCQHNLLVI